MGVATTSHKHFLATALPPFLLTVILYSLQHTSPKVVPQGISHLFSRNGEASCPIDFNSPNACNIAREACPDFDDDGLIPYLGLYACAGPAVQPWLLFVMLLWLPMLFASMAMAAGDFLAVHLEFIVKTVGISENLAGVTIFAFGNGCTDLFATLAAMGANSGSLAISELFGAAAFITTVVLGAIILINPFSVNPRAFVGDVVWFIIAASLLVAFLADGQLILGECLGIIGLYCAFAIFAVLRPSDRPRTDIPDPSPAIGAFRDDAESEHGSYEDTDNGLIRQESPIIDAATNDVEYTTSEAPSQSSASSESAFVHQAPPRPEYGENEAQAAITAQELEELTLPPAVATATTANESESGAFEGSDLGVVESRDSTWKHFPAIHSWNDQGVAERILAIFSLPLLIPIGLTTPTRHELMHSNYDVSEDSGRSAHVELLPLTSRWTSLISTLQGSLTNRWVKLFDYAAYNWMLCMQLVLGPQFFAVVVISQSVESAGPLTFFVGSVASLVASALLVSCVAFARKADLLVSCVAFMISLTWIYLTATSAVTLLMTLALIFDIPSALLGATIFAIGQSSNDLVANTAVARRGMSVLAASATFGGPMMNMFMGIGGGGLVQVLKSKQGVYTFETAAGMFVSASNLLIGLAVTLAYAFWNGWRLERGLGIALIVIWVAFTVVNVGLSMAA